MASTTTTLNIPRKLETESPTRQRVMGIIFMVIAAAIWLLFIRGTQPGLIASFGLNPGGAPNVLPEWEVPVLPALYMMAIANALLGVIQISKGFQRYTNLVLGLVAAFFIFSFLVWAAAGQSLNLAGLALTTLGRAVPLTLGAMAGILCERAGVFNIAIEGMMLGGAMVSVAVSGATQNVWAGVASAMLMGLLLSWIHAVLSIKYKTNQIISGTVINILSIGLTSYISSKFIQAYQETHTPDTFPSFVVPVLSKIPLIGPILFRNNMYVYLMLILVIVLQIALFYTRWGLRMRAVGEHPKAADTLGINVIRMRYLCVLMGGMMAGFAGSYFTLGSVGRFDQVMTAGRGFIALAAMIFGKYMPVGSFGAGLLFGFADSLATRLAILGVNIPSEFLLMAPYITTMVVLAGVVGRVIPPAAGGIPYEKE